MPWLASLKQPTLILAGNDDPIIPLVNAKLLRRLIPNARLHVYEGGHIALLTEPTALAPLVEDFLAEPTAG